MASLKQFRNREGLWAAFILLGLLQAPFFPSLWGDKTLLESARRAGLTPPFSCEAGNCGTCMARLSEGSATMRVNDALMDDEVEEGYVLTCQAIPDTPSVTVHYED